MSQEFAEEFCTQGQRLTQSLEYFGCIPESSWLSLGLRGQREGRAFPWDCAATPQHIPVGFWHFCSWILGGKVDGSWTGCSHSPPEVLGVLFQELQQILPIMFQVENLLFQFCAEILEQCW